MIRVKYIASSLFLFMLTTLSSQTAKEFKWPNGAKAAISLTYDDGLPSHINTVAPILKKYKFKATFYPTISSPSIYEDIEKWRNIAQEGHELGNHTVYHPCQKSKTGMEWVKDYHDLDKYTLEQIFEEIKIATTFLLALDKKATRTFAYPCAHYFAGGKSYKSFIASNFIAARGSSEKQKKLLQLSDIDLYNVPSWAPNNHSSQQIIAYIQKIIDQKTLSTLTFHGIGAEHLTVSETAHEEVLQFLDSNQDKIWVATFKEVTTYLKSERKKQTKNLKK